MSPVSTGKKESTYLNKFTCGAFVILCNFFLTSTTAFIYN